MRLIVERKLEQVMLSEPNSFRELMTDVQTYESLKRMSVQSPESITVEELEAAKEAILERWPAITDLEAALESTGVERRAHFRRLITEGKQIPRSRPARIRETPDQRKLRFEDKLTKLKDKAKNKKNR